MCQVPSGILGRTLETQEVSKSLYKGWEKCQGVGDIANGLWSTNGSLSERNVGKGMEERAV